MFLKWPPRSTLASDLFWWVRLNILNSNPKPSTNVKFEVIWTCFWSDLQGQLLPLTSFGRSDWIFSILTPNHPIWTLKSFQHVFEVTNKWIFSILTPNHPKLFNSNHFWHFFKFQFLACVRFPIITIPLHLARFPMSLISLRGVVEDNLKVQLALKIVLYERHTK